jgi:hypothetical protein
MTMAAPTSDDPGFDLDRPIRLRPLTFLDEGDTTTVGCHPTGSYAILDRDGARLIRLLAAGMTPNAAARWYARAYGDEVDIVDLLEALTELRFLAGPGEPVTVPEPIRWQRLARALFGPIGWACFALLTAAAATAMITTPAVRPGYHDLFFTRYLLLIGGVVILGQVGGTLIHEAFHALAGRRLGLPSSLRVSRRLMFVVFETNLDGLVTVPRRRRYLPILAGMIADVGQISVLTLIGTLTRRGGALGDLGGTALALSYVTVLRLAWQLFLYLQTDLYVLATTMLRCNDLQATTKQVLRNRLWRLLRRPHRTADETMMVPRDLAVARTYSWLVLFGYGFSLAAMVLVLVPTIWQLIVRTAGQLVDGGNWSDEADSAVFLMLNLLFLTLLAVLAIRDRRRRRREVPLTHVLT